MDDYDELNEKHWRDLFWAELVKASAADGEQVWLVISAGGNVTWQIPAAAAAADGSVYKKQYVKALAPWEQQNEVLLI